MEIRFAQQRDIRQIVELCKEHARYEKSDFDPANKIELLTKYLFNCQGNIKCLVVEQDDEIVGYATYVKQFSTWEASYYIYLDCLFLKEKARGKSWGTQIMQIIKEGAKSENCKIIQWQTPYFNEKAIAFYKKLGAVSKAKERFYWDV